MHVKIDNIKINFMFDLRMHLSITTTQVMSASVIL